MQQNPRVVETMADALRERGCGVQAATPGEVTLSVNGESVGSGRLDHRVPCIFSRYAGMDVGRDNGLVVDRSYADKAPFAFTGIVKKVTFDVAPHLDDDEEHVLHEHASQVDTARGISG